MLTCQGNLNLHSREQGSMNENALIISTINEGVLNGARRVVFLSRRSLTARIQYRVEPVTLLTTFPTQQCALQPPHSWNTRLRKYPHLQASDN